MRLIKTVTTTIHEVKEAIRLCSNVRSRLQLSADIVLFRLLRISRLPIENRVRQIQLKQFGTISYRLNRGDIQSIREVFMDQVYRLPFDSKAEVLIDLGANIGLTSRWYYETLRPRVIIAVEPNASNAKLARENLAGLPADVIEAAVGSYNGTGYFAPDRASNLGSLTSNADGAEIAVRSMSSVLEGVPCDVETLVKLDIEGGEEDLLTGNLDWLARITGLIVEFHPDQVDYPRLVRILQDEGFDYIPAGSRWPGSMDAFCRAPRLGQSALA